MKKRLIYLALSLAFAGLILFTCFRTAGENEYVGGRIIGWVNATFFSGGLSAGEQQAVVGAGAKLIGHFSLFFLCGMFAYLTKEKEKAPMWWLCLYLGYGVFLSALGEAMELTTAGRVATFYDVIINASGFFSFGLVAYLWKKES